MQQTNLGESSVAKVSLKGKILEEIADSWQSKLREHEASFSKAAAEVKEWDEALLESESAIDDMSDDVREVLQNLKVLDESVDMMNEIRESLDKQLDDAERKLDAKLNEKRKVGYNVGARERQKNYDLVTQLDNEVASMGTQLSRMIDQLNSTFDVTENSESEYSQILHVINAQQRALQWIDEKCNELHFKKIKTVQEKLTTPK